MKTKQKEMSLDSIARGLGTSLTATTTMATITMKYCFV